MADDTDRHDTGTDGAEVDLSKKTDRASADGATAASEPVIGAPAPPPASPPPAPASQPASGPSKWPTVVASILVVALVAIGAWLLIDRQSADERDRQREAFLQAARQTVLNLTTIRAETADADVQRLIDGATGDFKAEFEGREGPFVEVVQQAGVTTTGEVLEAGIQNEDGTCASSLVASRAMVSNADQTDPAPRDFRLRVTICDEDGRLLASKVEFVP